MQRRLTSIRMAIALLLAGISLGAFADSVLPDLPFQHPTWNFRSIALVPVQNGGRIKPLDSFAREVVLFETGSRTYQGWNSLDLLFSWIAHPTFWEKEPFLRINRQDVRRQLGLDEERTTFSPSELFHNSVLLQYAERSGSEGAGVPPPTAPRSNPRDQELKGVLERLSLFHGIVSGNAWMLIPKAEPQAWLSVNETDPEGSHIRNQFGDLVRAYLHEDAILFSRASQLFRASVEGEIPNYEKEFKNQVAAEVLYNRIRPFFLAWVFYLVAAFLWGVTEFTKTDGIHRVFKNGALAATWIAVGSHAIGFGLRCLVAGRPPVTNMYESVIWVSLGIMAFAFLIYARQRQNVVLGVATFLSMLGLIAGDAAPAILDPSIRPLMPVLRNNFWLTIHVLTITLGYAAFALTLGLSNITLFQFLRNEKGPEKGQKILALNQLTYRAMQFGVVFIAAGTILGGIWADYSWGRFWGWDPKEVWALITLLAYIVILHGRYTNWVGQFGFAAFSAVSFLTVVMAWYGVNFILGVGLHSYGFSTGGTPWVAGFVAAQLLYILGVTGVHFSRIRSKKIAHLKSC